MPEKTSGPGAEPQRKGNVRLLLVDYPSNSVTDPPSICVIGLIHHVMLFLIFSKTVLGITTQQGQLNLTRNMKALK